MEKSFRIRTNINEDKVLKVNLQQDYDFLEVLSLSLSQQNAYKLHTSNYGVIVGRVLANDAFGIPNAKVSVFVELTEEDAKRSEVLNIYPYTSTSSKDKDNIRYNLLKDESYDECYSVVGTFPNKRYVLDNDTQVEIFDKYWKYTTVTNNSGDYMLFGVPSGAQQIHVDLDLSDIGILSQKPRDFFYKGYTETQFENASQFKESTNLDSLSQIISENSALDVYPFWGDEQEGGVVAITRHDVNVNYKFEPTCVFMGSILTDSQKNNLGHRCTPSRKVGKNDQLTTPNGVIEMIRKTTDGFIEEFQVQGNQLIDGDGVWCYQIPMNLDYVGTDEFGNVVPTDNPNKGIATRSRVRFRFTLEENGDEGISRHRARYLVPNNPEIVTNNLVETTTNGEERKIPYIQSGKEFEQCFEFGSATRDSDFRDLYWNNVYSVKSYVPRIQTTSNKRTRNYSGLKATNYSDDLNPIPFNHIGLRLPFGYKLLCLVTTIVVKIIKFVNKIICILDKICIFRLCPFKIGCISFNMGFGEDDGDDNIAYLPGCSCKRGRKYASCPNDEKKCDKVWEVGEILDKVQQTLAQEYEVASLDFYNDWINGTLYFPLWFWKKQARKNILFGLFHRKARNIYCSCKRKTSRTRLVQTCALKLNSTSKSIKINDSKDSTASWHNVSKRFKTKLGLIYEKDNKDGLQVYYYAPGLPNNPSYNNLPSKVPYLRLFSTDLILLGSLNDANLSGLPQFFAKLPTTTANIPYMASIIEGGISEDGDSEEITTTDEVNDNASAQTDEGFDETLDGTGKIEITGMDWLNKGAKDNPKYSKGLFFDLTCTKAKTRIKSCINAERMCELGVTYDGSYTETDVNGNEVEYESDGIVTRFEIVDNDARAMFASLNGIGLENKSQDPLTNLPMYKLNYTYVNNFEGKISNYINGYTTSSDDTADPNYIYFRYGEQIFGYSNNFLLTNNSFYFYFGLKEGSTAIDKFNKMFYSNCYKNKKEPFSYTFDVVPARNCPRENAVDEDNNTIEYGVISVNFTKIKKPYSYVLTDLGGNVLDERDNINENSIYIGAASGKVSDDGSEMYDFYGINEDSIQLYIKEGEEKTETKFKLNVGGGTVKRNGSLSSGGYLINGIYNLEITDVAGDTMTEVVVLDSAGGDFIADEFSLIAEFKYDEDTYGQEGAVLSDDANYQIFSEGDGKLCGMIAISNIQLDGYEMSFGSSSLKPIPSERTSISELTLTDGNILRIEVKEALSDRQMDWCMIGEPTFNDHDPKISVDNSINYNIFYPSTYKVEITQLCGENEDGSKKWVKCSEKFVVINNANSMEVFLNDVSTKFLLGDSNGKYNKNFYNPSAKTPYEISGWMVLHDPDAYSENTFAPLNEDNFDFWSDYVSLTSEVNESGETTVEITEESKLGVEAFKLECICRLCNTLYINDDDNIRNVAVSVLNGDKPILHRGLYPNYGGYSDSLTTYTMDSLGSVENDIIYPNIVGFNASLTLSNDPGSDYSHYYNSMPLLLAYFAEKSDDAEKGIWKTKDEVRFNPMFKDIEPNSGKVPKDDAKLEKYNSVIGNNFGIFSLNGGYNENCTTNGDRQKRMVSYPIRAEMTSLVCPGASDEAIDVTSSDFQKYKTSHYLRVDTLDRRMDYSLLFYIPPYSNVLSNSFEGAYSLGRIFGSIINGNKMAYGENGSIISENASDGLEYYYKDDDGNIKLQYNDTRDAYLRRKYYYASIKTSSINSNINPFIFGKAELTPPLTSYTSIYGDSLFETPISGASIYSLATDYLRDVKTKTNSGRATPPTITPGQTGCSTVAQTTINYCFMNGNTTQDITVKDDKGNFYNKNIMAITNNATTYVDVVSGLYTYIPIKPIWYDVFYQNKNYFRISEKYPTIEDAKTGDIHDMYPFVSHINVGGIERSNKLTYTVASCSYDINTEIVYKGIEGVSEDTPSTYEETRTDKPSIKAETQVGEISSFDLDCRETISFYHQYTNNDYSSSWDNYEMLYKGKKHKVDGKDDVALISKMQKSNVLVKIERDKYNSTHESFTKRPVIINLINREVEDGEVKYYSPFNDSIVKVNLCSVFEDLFEERDGGDDSKGVDKLHPKYLVEHSKPETVTLRGKQKYLPYTGLFASKYSGSTIDKNESVSTIICEHYDGNDNNFEFYTQNGDENNSIIFDNSSDASSIIYAAKDLKWRKNHNKTTICAFLTERMYLNNAEDNLLKEIKVLKLSSPFSMEDLYMEYPSYESHTYETNEQETDSSGTTKNVTHYISEFSFYVPINPNSISSITSVDSDANYMNFAYEDNGVVRPLIQNVFMCFDEEETYCMDSTCLISFVQRTKLGEYDENAIKEYEEEGSSATTNVSTINISSVDFSECTSIDGNVSGKTEEQTKKYDELKKKYETRDVVDNFTKEALLDKFLKEKLDLDKNVALKITLIMSPKEDIPKDKKKASLTFLMANGLTYTTVFKFQKSNIENHIFNDTY